jgi:hypothetical protein
LLATRQAPGPHFFVVELADEAAEPDVHQRGPYSSR